MLLLHWKPQVEDEVGRVTSCRQGTGSPSGLVDWALVRMAIVDQILLLWQDPNALHLGEEDLWHGLFECLLPFVPSGSFNEETVDVHAVFWLLGEIVLGLIGDDDEVEVNLINGNHMLSGIVLLGASQERLCEEES